MYFDIIKTSQDSVAERQLRTQNLFCFYVEIVMSNITRGSSKSSMDMLAYSSK